MGEFSYKDWKVGGIPAWALGIAVLIVAIGVVWRYTAEPERDLLVARELNKSQQADLQEYLSHVGRPPVKTFLFVDDDHDRLEVGIFPDRCTLLTRETTNGVRTMLVRDLALDKDAAPKRMSSSLLEIPVEAAGGCLANHPQMQFKDEQFVNGCWLVTRRTFQDGCVLDIPWDQCHRQGAPPQWQRCVH